MLIYAAFAAVVIGTGARWTEVADMTFDDLFDQDWTPRKKVSRMLAKKRRKKSKGKIVLDFLANNWDVTAKMKVSDVFTPAGEIKIDYTGKTTESRPGKKKEIEFPWSMLGAPIIAWKDKAIEKYHFNHSHRIFSLHYDNHKLSHGNSYLKNRRLLRLAGVDWRRVAFHGWRTTFLVMVYEQCKRNGMGDFEAANQVKEMIGHESLDTLTEYLKEYIGQDSGNIIIGAFENAFRNARAGK